MLRHKYRHPGLPAAAVFSVKGGTDLLHDTFSSVESPLSSGFGNDGQSAPHDYARIDNRMGCIGNIACGGIEARRIVTCGQPGG